MIRVQIMNNVPIPTGIHSGGSQFRRISYVQVMHSWTSCVRDACSSRKVYAYMKIETMCRQSLIVEGQSSQFDSIGMATQLDLMKALVSS